MTNQPKYELKIERVVSLLVLVQGAEPDLVEEMTPAHFRVSWTLPSGSLPNRVSFVLDACGERLVFANDIQPPPGKGKVLQCNSIHTPDCSRCARISTARVLGSYLLGGRRSK